MSPGEPPIENIVLAESVESPGQIQPRPWGFWATLGFSFAVMVMFTLVQLFVLLALVVVQSFEKPNFGAHDLGEVANSGLYLSVASCISAPVCLALIVLFAKLRKHMTIRDYLSLNWVSAKNFVVWTAIVLVYVAITDGMTWLLGRDIVPEFMVETYHTAGFAPLLWVALIIAAPVFEELFFRGFMFRGIQYSLAGSLGAILITSLAWSIVHVQYDVYQVSEIFVSGMLLGIARSRHNSTALTVVLHSLMNLIATIELEVYLWQ
jgi:uncharacterized protein